MAHPHLSIGNVAGNRGKAHNSASRARARSTQPFLMIFEPYCASYSILDFTLINNLPVTRYELWRRGPSRRPWDYRTS